MSTSTSTTQSEAGGLRPVPGLDPREVPGSLAHAATYPEAAIAWARAHRELWLKRAADNANRESGWSNRLAAECVTQVAFADQIELRALYVLLNGVNPAAVAKLLQACETAIPAIESLRKRAKASVQDGDGVPVESLIRDVVALAKGGA